MKKLICLLLFFLTITVNTQTMMRIWKNGVKIDSVIVTSDLKITFGAGSSAFNCGVSKCPL